MLKKLTLLAIFTVFAIGIFSVPTYSQTNERSRINRQIRKEILTLPYYNVFDVIGYSMNGDTVTLSGYVTRGTTKSDAAEAVADIDGVQRVVNNIELLPLSASDDRLRYRILQTFVNRGGGLYRYFMGSNGSIRIIVRNSRVTLEGTADNKADANTAYILARGVSGSLGVTNNLKILTEM